MLRILLEFFAVYKKVSVPGVGTLSVQYSTPEDHFGSRTITPSRARVIFHENQDDDVIARFEKFAVSRYDKSLEELNGFYKNFIRQLNQEERLNLGGIGILEKEDGRIIFKQIFNTNDFFGVLSAEKVVREHAEHTITVGENERTSTQMREALAKQESKKYWWVYVLIVLLIAAAGYLFYKYYFLK